MWKWGARDPCFLLSRRLAGACEHAFVFQRCDTIFLESGDCVCRMHSLHVGTPRLSAHLWQITLSRDQALELTSFWRQLRNSRLHTIRHNVPIALFGALFPTRG